jgi:ribosomal protein L37E
MISGTLLDDKENKTFLDGSDRTGSLRAKPSPQDDPTTIDASTTSSSDISNPITDPLQTENNSENLITCRYCGFTAVPALAKFCMDCGKALKTDTNIWKMCPLCDAMATNDAVFCTQCKQKFPQSLA